MTNRNDDAELISRRDFVRTAALAATVVGAGMGLSASAARAADPAPVNPAPANPTPANPTPANPAPVNPGANAAGTNPAVTNPVIPNPSGEKPMVGFQAEVTYLLSYGIAKFLDDVQNRASVNAVFLHGAPFDASWAGIDPSSPLGNFAAAHPEYYGDVFMKPQALAAGDASLPDAMEKITAETKKRGIKIFFWMEEDNRPPLKITGMDQLYEVDLHGRRTAGNPGGPCLNNPYFRNLIADSVEDYLKSYEVDGLQRGSERQGPLGNALGAWHHGAKSDPGHTSCFCDYCAAKADKLGINFARVKKAYLALEPFVRAGRAGQRPRDGYFVEFWRLLLQYPELLTWENFWADSMREMQREFFAKAKSIKPGVRIGFHIWQNVSFNPMYRAEQDYAAYTEYADFLKPAIYDNPAGERMASFVDSLTQNIFGDLGKQQMLDFVYSVMGEHEKPYATLSSGAANQRFSSDYVFGETQRAVAAVANSKTKICPGLGIDVQVKNSTPESVRDAVQAVFKAGGAGIVLSTSHAAMRPENLSAVGATLKELKLA
jgi:hypothetical protein